MKKLDTVYAIGTQQFPIPAPGTAREIKNLDYDPSLRAWNNETGWVSYYATASQSTSSVYSIYSWTPRGKNEKLIYEINDENNRLSLVYAAPYETSGFITLNSGRHIPTFQEAGTTYAPFGNFIIITNGYDNPIKWSGYSNFTTDFGFSVIPSPPQPIGVSDENIVGSGSGATPVTFYEWATIWGENENFINVPFNYDAKVGLGDIRGTDSSSVIQNGFAYKVSFISETNSESPLSAPSSIIAWDNAETGSYATKTDGIINYPSKLGIQLNNIPQGPIGTIKRRLYRTKNLTNQSVALEQTTFYFLDDLPNNYETAYCDLIPDAELGSESPTELESVIIPRKFKFCSTFGNRVILAGGTAYPTRVFFSRPFRPEQFGAFDFIELGNRDGGEITGLIASDNLLLVFRERGIDALVPTQNPDSPFYAVPVFFGLGTVATKTAVSIGGLGVVFATADGVYIFNGNFSGGDKVSITKISDQIGEDYSRVSSASIARAVAIYDIQNKSYVLSVPVDGGSYNNLIFSYNLDVAGWTIRESVPASCFTIAREGNVIFGTNTKDAGQSYPTSLGVLCKTNTYGYTASYEPATKPSGSWTSAWLDLGDPDATKNVRTVSFNCYTTNASVTVSCGYDWDYDYVYTINGSVTVADGEEQQNWSTVDVGVAKWENRRIAKVRFDVELPDVRFFRFKIEGAEPIKMIGYSVYFDMGGEDYAFNGLANYLMSPSNNQKVNPSKLPL